MGVPFEALLPYGIMVGFFMITGVGLTEMRYWRNDWKRQRYNVDTWDKQMMARDRRLTGTMRGQTDQVKAPVGFEFSNAWKLERGQH